MNLALYDKSWDVLLNMAKAFYILSALVIFRVVFIFNLV